MGVRRRHADRGTRWWGITLLATGGLAALTAFAIAGLALVVARTVVTPPRRRAEGTRVIAVDIAGGTVTLESNVDSRLRGDYGFWFAGGNGYARIGDILASTALTVTRQITDIEFGDLSLATRGRLTGWFYLDPKELDYPFENIELETELGPAPAWLIPAEEATNRWVIQVHGRAVRRQETLRAVPVFRAAGFTTLIVSYRNDGDAPASVDGRYALGDTEWRDVDVAVKHAIEHGATDVVLMGWSMGGSTVLQELTRSEHSAVIRGVVLESPVIDWVTALRFQVELRRLPGPVGDGVLSIIGRSWGRWLTGQGMPIDLPRLDFVARAEELDAPILLMHSDDDGFVPVTASRALAAARPDIVRFEAFSLAGHVKLWNYDRVRWTEAIRSWLADLGLTGDPQAPSAHN